MVLIRRDSGTPSYPNCAAITVRVSGDTFTRITCGAPGVYGTASATWVASASAAPSVSGTPGATKNGGSGSPSQSAQGSTNNQGLGGDGAVVNGNGNTINVNRGGAGRPAPVLPLAFVVVVGAVAFQLMVV
jgi:hypothetical protein